MFKELFANDTMCIYLNVGWLVVWCGFSSAALRDERIRQDKHGQKVSLSSLVALAALLGSNGRAIHVKELMHVVGAVGWICVDSHY